MYSIEESIKHLKRQGYTRDFHIRNGQIIDTDHNENLLPENMKIEQTHRIDVDSGGAGQSVVFGVSNINKDARGIIVCGFGPSMDQECKDVLDRMKEA